MKLRLPLIALLTMVLTFHVAECKIVACGIGSSNQCRAPTGVCDNGGYCRGFAVTCPDSTFAGSSSVCRPSSGRCDPEERCSGSSPACPADVSNICTPAPTTAQPSTAMPTTASPSTAPPCSPGSRVMCRAAIGSCDAGAFCDGSSFACPASILQPNTTVCRPSTGICDVPEYCSGMSILCPSNSFLPQSTVCRTSTGACDIQEMCTGSSAVCPSDKMLPSTTVCQPSGPCNLPATCSGTSNLCPASILQPNTTICRASTGLCDVAEFCSGSSASCPPDAFMPATAVCRPSSGVCDITEYCSGFGTCPVDAVKSSSVICRQIAGTCDASAEMCDGKSSACPKDNLRQNGTICRPSTGACDPVEVCSGLSGACPPDLLLTKLMQCRPSTGVCDPAGLCSGTSGICPAQLLLGTETICRPSTSLCDLPTMCNGVNASCPAYVNSPCADGWNPILSPDDKKTQKITEGNYCGTLSDGSLVTMVLASGMFDVFISSSAATVSNTLQYARFNFFLDVGVNARVPVLTLAWAQSEGGWLKDATKPVMTLVDFDNSSIAIVFTWTYPPLLLAPSSLVLRPETCKSQIFVVPPGKYCGSNADNINFGAISAMLQVDPRSSNPSMYQTATLYMLSALEGSQPTEQALPLSIVQYNPATRIIFFVSSASPQEASVVYKLTFSGKLNTFQLYVTSLQVPYVTSDVLFLAPCPSRPLLVAGFHCISSDSTTARVAKDLVICLSSVSYINGSDQEQQFIVNIDMTDYVTLAYDTVAIPLTSPTWAIPVTPFLKSIGFFGIVYNFANGGYVFVRDHYTYTLATRLFPCASPSPSILQQTMFCGMTSNSISYAVRFGPASINLIAGQIQGNRIQCAVDQNPDSATAGCASNVTLVVRNATCFSQLKISSVNQLSGGLTIVSVSDGKTYKLLASNCIMPPVGSLTRYGGSTKTITNVNYFASVILNSTTDANRFMGITVKISNSTNVLAMMQARAILVAGGAFIFASPPNGTWGSTGAAVTFTMALYGTSMIIVGVTPPNSVDVLAIPSTSSTDALPSGRYCADLGAGDFVVIQNNVNGTTTIFASVSALADMTTLWVDILNQGSLILNSTLSKARRPFPVVLLNFSASSGYGLSIQKISSKTLFANQASCVVQQSSLPDGYFCGALEVGAPGTHANVINSTFGAVSIAWNASTRSYLTTIYASRRVSPSQPISLSFTDIPWLLPFFTPVKLSATMTGLLLSASDSVGSFSMSLTSALCSPPLTTTTHFCSAQPPLGQKPMLEAHVFVTTPSLADTSSSFGSSVMVMALALFVFNGTANMTVMTVPVAFVIGGNVRYWFGSAVPDLLIASGSADDYLVGQYSGKDVLLSSSACPQLLFPGSIYCATKGAVPMTLTSDLDLSDSITPATLTLVSGTAVTSFDRLRLSLLPPLRISGDVTLGQQIGGSQDVRNVQYFPANDTFFITMGVLAPITFTQGKCIAPIPDGEYCGYNDTTDRPLNVLNVINGSLFTRLPGRTERMKCDGGLTSAGGLLDCSVAPVDAYSTDVSRVLYSLTGAASAFVTYSAGKINASFSLIGGSPLYYSSASCNGRAPQLLRTFASTTAMQSTNFSYNTRVVVNTMGNLLIADTVRHCIFSINNVSGLVKLFAGFCDHPGMQDGAGKGAMFNTITGIVIDKADGNLYVLDAGNSRVRRITPNGVVTSFSGTGAASSVDGSGLGVSYLNLTGVAIHPTSGRLYIAEAYRIRILNQATNAVKTFVGSAAPGFVDAIGTRAQLDSPGKPAFAPDGLTMYFVDGANKCLRKVTSVGSVVTIVSSVPGGFLDISSASFSSFATGASSPPPTLVDSAGNVLIMYNDRIYIFVISSQVVTTYSGDSTQLVTPNATDFALSPSGALYIADGPRIHALHPPS